MYNGGMKTIKETRRRLGLSQRRLAAKARISFRALQMIESGETDPRLSSLASIIAALGTSKRVFNMELEHIFEEDPDSISVISRKIKIDGEDSWKRWIFDFVDAFRRRPHFELISEPPFAGVPTNVRCLMASIVESLCDESGMVVPWWCGGVGAIDEPWFVSGVENLKACALVESPLYFRKRNIFVLGNFLDRA